jgi:hypothetical protein
MAHPDEKVAFDLHKQLWAARVSNPARRIKRHVNPALVCVASCSFVLVSTGMELKAADLRVG